DLGTLLGKILRIDVESGVVPYAIPPDNPFVGEPGAQDEIWAWGLRNPWRFTFDRATDDLYIADVGQNSWEEVNYQAASSSGGENYGWRCYEGNHPFNQAGCGPLNDYIFPVVEYSHSLGCSVTGGYVYRGALYPRMQGVYFYGDYCSGRIWGLQNPGGGWQNTQLLDSSLSISSFGEDQVGNLYVTDLSGDVYWVADSETAIPMRSAFIALQSQPIGSGHLVTGQVLIVDTGGTPVPGATVNITWTKPSGSTRPQSATTNAQGAARFTIIGGAGTYTLTVANVTADGYIFVPDISFLSRSITVP
ncbi:MAG: PQQ-dependent sugar dehydrogenase, partial [Ardenticatenaceae bacterium]